MNRPLVSHSLPADWESPVKQFHGIARSSRLRGYIVSLMLNHRQYQFGPFRTGQLEAANAYDSLLKYFLAFTKAKPQPNCPAETFFNLKDEEAEEKYGRERLQSLRAKFKEEFVAAGLDFETELAYRADHVLNFCGLHTERVITYADKRRRNALIQLEAMQLRAFKTSPLIVEHLRVMGLNKEQRNALEETLRATMESQTRFCAALELLIGESKALLGFDPNVSIPPLR